jgi:quercetin dioxygenase-like cupin family protein
VCTHGEEPAAIRAGDVVWVPPGERHWHGGTAETIMTHLAVSLGPTIWLDEVSEDDYPGVST